LAVGRANVDWAAGFATDVICALCPRTANMQPASGQKSKMPP